MYGKTQSSCDFSQGTSNFTPGGAPRRLGEPGVFTQTLGIFGSVITNR
jgi:hypothetical protein